jgi:hypothetical protein
VPAIVDAPSGKGNPSRDGRIENAARARVLDMADGELVVTTAADADVAGVIALIGRVFAEYGFVYDPAVEVPDLLRFPAHYEAPRGAFFVVRQGGVVVGSVGVERLDADTAELHRL